MPYHLAMSPRKFLLERETGFEPATSTLARLHSTTELLPRGVKRLIGDSGGSVNRKKAGKRFFPAFPSVFSGDGRMMERAGRRNRADAVGIRFFAVRLRSSGLSFRRRKGTCGKRLCPSEARRSGHGAGGLLTARAVSVRHTRSLPQIGCLTAREVRTSLGACERPFCGREKGNKRHDAGESSDVVP